MILQGETGRTPVKAEATFPLIWCKRDEGKRQVSDELDELKIDPLVGVNGKLHICFDARGASGIKTALRIRVRLNGENRNAEKNSKDDGGYCQAPFCHQHPDAALPSVASIV